MMAPYFQVDAFTEHVFSGNPAGVCLLERWMPEALLQQIAAENNLSETAFLVGSGDSWELRWFTPTVEVDLCGHATLAAGASCDVQNMTWPLQSVPSQHWICTQTVTFLSDRLALGETDAAQPQAA